MGLLLLFVGSETIDISNTYGIRYCGNLRSTEVMRVVRERVRMDVRGLVVVTHIVT